MPKKHTKRNFKGGYLDISKSLTDLGTSIKNGASNMWSKTKNEFSKLTSSNTQGNSYQPTPPPPYQPSSQPSYQPSYQPTPSYGGSKRRKSGKFRKSRRMKGGYKDNISLTNLASTAAPFSGATARAHNWVGGRKKRRTKRINRR
jgi:hypothetical protein